MVHSISNGSNEGKAQAQQVDKFKQHGYAQGILMTQRVGAKAAVQQALMYLDVLRAELRIVGAVMGKPIGGPGCTFHTLRGALAAFPQWAATWPLPDDAEDQAPSNKSRMVVDLMADSTQNAGGGVPSL